MNKFIKMIFMKKLRYFFLVIVFLSTTTIIAQSKADIKIKELAKKMFVDMNNRDYESILDMSHPKLFEVASREQIITNIKSMLEGNNDVKIEIPKTIPPYRVSKIFVKQKDSFAFVSYDLNMEMTFKNQSFIEETKKGMKAAMLSQGMEAEFTSDNSMKVIMNDRVTVLIKDKNTNEKWAMLNYDPSPMISSLLPSEVMEAAKEYQNQLIKERKEIQERKTNKSE